MVSDWRSWHSSGGWFLCKLTASFSIHLLVYPRRNVFSSAVLQRWMVVHLHTTSVIKLGMNCNRLLHWRGCYSGTEAHGSLCVSRAFNRWLKANASTSATPSPLNESLRWTLHFWTYNFVSAFGRTVLFCLQTLRRYVSVHLASGLYYRRSHQTPLVSQRGKTFKM